MKMKKSILKTILDSLKPTKLNLGFTVAIATIYTIVNTLMDLIDGFLEIHKKGGTDNLKEFNKYRKGIIDIIINMERNIGELESNISKLEAKK